ncbi:MAG: radical SAM protein [Polyangiaceae bacterium]|nr:radical SAM protein [Polyangiaceae bacterium]
MGVDFDLGIKASGGLPLVAQILVSDACNHACEHCYQVHGRKGEMSLDEIDAVLEELARLGILIVSLSGGEASLRPDLPDVLRAARRRSFAIILQTNAYALSDHLVDTIADVGVWRVRVSVYSDVAAEHDAVTRVAGSFERTTAAVRALRARGVPVTAVVPLTSRCSAPADRLEALARDLGCDLEISGALTAREDGSAEPLAVEPSRDQLGAYFLAERLRGAPIPDAEARLAEPPCAACSSSLTVHSDGSVRPCTHIPLELARASQDGAGAAAIAALHEDDAFRFLAGITWRDLHGCRDCALMPWCSRCHGSASFEAGDLLGPQPSACARALVRFEAHAGPLERLPAEDAGAAARRPDVGPFERVGARGIRPARDALTAADEALARRFPWIRPTRARLQELAGILPAARLVRRRRDETASLLYAAQERSAP